MARSMDVVPVYQRRNCADRNCCSSADMGCVVAGLEMKENSVNDLMGFLVLLFIAPLAVYPLVMVPLCVGLLIWFAIQDAWKFLTRT